MKPLLRILLSVIIAAVLCELTYLAINSQLKKYQKHTTDKLSELFHNKTAYDIVFLGSSKTHANINPYIVDSVCSVNSYNAGIDGISFFEYNIILDAFLVNHPPPKILVVSYDLHSLNGSRRFFNPSQYMKYVSNPVVDSALNNNGYPTLPLKIFPFLTLTNYSDDDKIVNVIKGKMGRSEILDGDFQYKGYLSNTDIVMEDKTKLIQRQEISEEGMRLFESIRSTCMKNNIKLVLVYSPEYKQGIIKLTPNASVILDTIKKKAVEYNIPLLRNDSLALCNEARFFRNTGHLNKAGAVEYSRILATQLNTLMQVRNSATN